MEITIVCLYTTRIWIWLDKKSGILNQITLVVIAFLPRSKHLLISWLCSPSALILEPKKRCITASTLSLSTCQQVMGPDDMILGLSGLSFKPVFSLSSWETYTVYWKRKTLLCWQRSKSQSYGFSGSHKWIWELDYKRPGCWGVDGFELWCRRKLLRIPWTAGRSNQSVLEEINPECSLEVLMLKLKLQHFGHLMWRANSLEKTLMLGKMEAKRKRGWQRKRQLDSITDSADLNLS